MTCTILFLTSIRKRFFRFLTNSLLCLKFHSFSQSFHSKRHSTVSLIISFYLGLVIVSLVHGLANSRRLEVGCLQFLGHARLVGVDGVYRNVTVLFQQFIIKDDFALNKFLNLLLHNFFRKSALINLNVKCTYSVNYLKPFTSCF